MLTKVIEQLVLIIRNFVIGLTIVIQEVITIPKITNLKLLIGLTIIWKVRSLVSYTIIVITIEIGCELQKR